MRTWEEMPWVLPRSPGNPPALDTPWHCGIILGKRTAPDKIQPISPQDVPVLLDVAFSQLSWLLLRPSELVHHSFPSSSEPLNWSHCRSLMPCFSPGSHLLLVP